MADADALTAILGLTGQLLDHSADIQNIRTTALLDRDRMEFEAAQLEKERKLAWDQDVFKLQMNDLKIMEGELDEVNEQYQEPTGKIPENPTSGFTEFHQKGKEKAKNYEDLLDHRAKQQQKVALDIKTRKRELNDITNALAYIKKNVNYAGGKDSTKWDPGDYADAIKAYKAKANLGELTEGMTAAIEKETPGSVELQNLNLVLAEKSAKETQQKLNLAQLRHEEHNLDQTKILMDIQSDRETLALFPELQSIMTDGSEVANVISDTMTSEDFKDNPNNALKEAHESIASVNPLFDLVGANIYLEAYGAATGTNAAPEYFIQKVITPAVATIQAYGEFMIAYPEAKNKTFANEDEKKEYTKKRQARLDGFFVKLSKTIGIPITDTDGKRIKENIVNAEKIKAVAKKLQRLLGTEDILNNRLTSYSKLISGNVQSAIDAGLDGKGDLRIHLDPHIQGLLEAIKTLGFGAYHGSQQDSTAIPFNINDSTEVETSLKSLEISGLAQQNQDDEEWVKEQQMKNLMSSAMGPY